MSNTEETVVVEKVKMILISEDVYYSLLEDSILLEALNELGVDIWDGYEQAQELYEEKLNHIKENV